MIGDARRIFIAYAHGDLRVARDLRRRILRLRDDRKPESVFLDQDSLPPAAPVSPAVIDSVLKESDLLIVLCGDDTARRPEVNRELAVALKLRAEGRLSILPIVIKHGVRLPDGLDYEIQGVFLKVLFPEVVIWPLAASVAIVALLVAVGVFLRDGRINEIDRDFQQLRAEPLPAYGNSYQRRTCELRGRARSWRASELGARIDLAMLFTPRSDHSALVLETNGGNDSIVAAIGCGSGAVLATRSRLMWFSSANSKASREYRIDGGRIVELRAAPEPDRIAYVIEHADFADPAESLKHKNGNDYPVNLNGSERSAVTISCQFESQRNEAVVRTYSKSDGGGETLRAVDDWEGYARIGFAGDRSTELRELLARSTFNDPMITLEVKLLVDTEGHPEDIYVVTTWFSPKLPFEEQGAFFYLFTFDGKEFKKVWASSKYHPDAEDLRCVDDCRDSRTGEKTVVLSTPPKFSPAAYSPVSGFLATHDRIVNVRDRGFSTEIKLPATVSFGSVASARFDRAGRTLFLRTNDGQLIAINPTAGTTTMMTRTPTGDDSSALVDGDHLWLLQRFDERRAASIRLDTFGPDSIVKPDRSMRTQSCESIR